MSSNPTVQAPPSPDVDARLQAERARSADSRRRPWLRRIIALALVIALIAVGLPAVMSWIEYRRTHSITALCENRWNSDLADPYFSRVFERCRTIMPLRGQDRLIRKPGDPRKSGEKSLL